MRSLPAFQLERYFAEHEFSTPHLLCASDLQSFTIAELCSLEDGAQEALLETWLGYTEAQGDPELRSAIAGLYDSLTAEQVIVHSGGVEAIFTAMHATVSAGDRVIVQMPCYQTLHEVARSLGAEIVHWELRAEESWRPDLDRLEDLLATGARAVVVNYPHNPTGTTLEPAEWERLVERVAAHGAVLFSDEAYRFAEHRDEDRLASAADLDDQAVCMGLVSKAFGLPGLRIAWLATRNPDVARGVTTLKDYTTICASAPSERLATLALRHAPRLLERNVGILRTHLGHLQAFMDRQRRLFDALPPKAGPICFPRWRGPGSVETLVEAARGVGVLLAPGHLFGMAEHLRLGFGRADFAEVLAIFESFLDRRYGGG